MNTSNQDLIILTSPPASGKTFWIKNLQGEFHDVPILVVSPLRALADECKANWPSSIQVMTPEEWLNKKIFCEIVIFDEFHLFFYWGDIFRPLMWEMFFEVTQKASLTFLLTATLSKEMQEEIKNFDSQFSKIFWIDHGNQMLKFVPNRYIKAPGKKWILNQIKKEKKNDVVKLIFCQYRNEVLEMERMLNQSGFNCISCIGGESRYMAGKLKQNPRPDFIISTTVLSHGVNLPSIRKVFFTYKINNLDFWIQMVARGGRRGEKFTVYSLEKPACIKWNRFQNFLLVLWESIKLKLSSAEFMLTKT